MKSGGFGRRVAEPVGRKLVLVPASPLRGPVEDLSGRGELKEPIRTVLMSRIDPSVAGQISLTNFATSACKIRREIRLATEGSIRDIKTVRICSLR